MSTFELRANLAVFGYIRKLQILVKCNSNGSLFNYCEPAIIHTCLAYYYNKSGILYCFGLTRDDQLGLQNYDGTPTINATFNENNLCMTISSFGAHSMCIDTKGNLYGFGLNDDGQLGLDHTNNISVPTLITSMIQYNIRQVCVGGSHSLFLTNNGNAWSVGGNECGQLGHGNWENMSKPKVIETLQKYNIIQVSVGINHNCVITECNGVYGWGNNRYGQCGVGEDKEYISVPTMVNITAMKVICGKFHTLLLTANGRVLSYGYGAFGQLGYGSTKKEWFPKVIDSLKDIVISNIFCGYFHSFCITETGNIYGFGRNECGQLGLGNVTNSLFPQKISYFSENNIKIVLCDCGYTHSAFVSEEGCLYMCGNGSNTELGTDTIKETNSIPFKVSAFENKFIQTVSLGNRSTFVIVK